jgi:hypothetical protein
MRGAINGGYCEQGAHRIPDERSRGNGVYTEEYTPKKDVTCIREDELIPRGIKREFILVSHINENIVNILV